jgi:hypothetical protein
MKALSFLCTSVAAALVSRASANKAIEYLEPNVQRLVGVLPKSVCKQLIDLGEEGRRLVQLNRFMLFVCSHKFHVGSWISRPKRINRFK